MSAHSRAASTAAGLWLLRIGAVAALALVAAMAFAQDPYDDDPVPPAQPKTPPAKAPAAKPKAPPAKPPAAKPKAPAAKPKAPAAQPKAPAAQPKEPPARPLVPTPGAATRRKPHRQPPAGQRRGDPNARSQARQARDMLEKLKRKKTGSPAPKRAKRNARDAHGYCLGQGPDDRPKDINLVHGWLGVNNDKAARRPRVPRWEGNWWNPRTWGPNLKAQWPFWKWRVTPYPYRYENHDDHCDPHNQPVPLLANIVNIAALIFLFVRFGRKPLNDALKRRKKGIMAEFDKAKTLRDDARGRLEKYEDDLDNLDERLVALRGQYAKEGELEEERMGEEMVQTRERLLSDADFRLAQEGKATRDDLSRDALEAALSAAEKLLLEKINVADHDRLALEYLEQIGPALRAAQQQGRPSSTSSSGDAQ